jgi:hypothetical protein
MSAHLSEREFQQYLDQKATGKEVQQIEQHLANCTNCQQELHLYREMYRALQQEPDFSLPADFSYKVMSRLTADKKSFLQRFYFENFLVILGILAAVIFVINLYGFDQLFQIFTKLPLYLDNFWRMLRNIFPSIPAFIKSGYMLAGLTLLIVITLFENSILRKRDSYFLL